MKKIKSISILGNSLIDMFVFWGFALLSIIVLKSFDLESNDNILLTAFTFLCLYIFDSGHVYLTFIRVAKEFKYAKYFFIATPILVFLFLYYIAEYDYEFFFYVIGYATVFHFIRQIYGINRWFLKIGKEKITQLRDNIIYLVTVIPLFILFFKKPINTIDYGYQFFFLHTVCNNCIINALNILFLVSIVSFLIQEFLFFKKGFTVNINRILFVLGTALVFWWIGNFASKPLEIIIPLVIVHGFTYFAVTVKYEKDFYKYNLLKAFIVAVFVAIIGGVSINYFYEKDFMYNNSILLALLFTPLFTHYIIDMKIWLNSYLKNYISRKCA